MTRNGLGDSEQPWPEEGPRRVVRARGADGPVPAPPRPAARTQPAPAGASRGGGAVSLSLVERQISFHDRHWLWGHAGRGCLWEDFKAPQKDAFLVATRLRARPLAAH